jgi:Zn-dependent M32 family carboxypeptidase
MNNNLFEKFIIFSWNGKDLFLRSAIDPDIFVVKTFSELTNEFQELVPKRIGREVKLYNDGCLELIKTRQELQEEADRRHRNLEILRDIRALEETEDLTEYHKKRLESLRKELSNYEHVDPTALTSEQQRANQSVWGKS